MPPGKIYLDKVVGDQLPTNVGFVVRVVRLWTTLQWGTNEGVATIQMVLQDETGKRIQASIDEKLISKFKDKIKEHGFYAMKNFRIVQNKEKFKPATHPFRLHFQKNTRIHPAERNDYHQNPLVLYNTIPIDAIYRIPPNGIDDLIDFIGAYSPKDGVKTGTNTKGSSTFVAFHLTDLSKKRIYCSLWDAYGDEAKAELENYTADDKFVVVLLQLCRVSRKGGVSISNSFHVSKVLIDEHIPEVEEFRREFKAVDERGARNSGYLSASSGTSKANGPGPMITIANLLHAKEAEGYYFYGEINNVDAQAGWYKEACPNAGCDTEVIATEDGYICSSCKGTAIQPLYKYKVTCGVKDNQATTTVLLFDEDCHRLIGKSVSELRVASSDQTVGVQDVPKEIDGFVGRCFLFKVGGSVPDLKGSRFYNIESLCDDPKLLAFNQNGNDESSDEDLDSDDDLSLMLLSATEVDSSATPQANESAMVTPSSKRCLTDNGEDTNDASMTQGSNNKKMKGVKIEKP